MKVMRSSSGIADQAGAANGPQSGADIIGTSRGDSGEDFFRRRIFYVNILARQGRNPLAIDSFFKSMKLPPFTRDYSLIIEISH